MGAVIVIRKDKGVTMYVVEGTTYHSFKELVREYNRRECMAGMELTPSFVKEYRICAKQEKERRKNADCGS